MQHDDRAYFEALRFMRRKNVQLKDELINFDAMCSKIRQQMRDEHKNIRDNFQMFVNLSEQRSYSKMMHEINFGLDYFYCTCN